MKSFYGIYQEFLSYAVDIFFKINYKEILRIFLKNIYKKNCQEKVTKNMLFVLQWKNIFLKQYSLE